METEDAFFYGLTVVMYIYLTIVNNFFLGWLRGVLNGIGITGFIAILFLQDLVIQMKIAPFIYLEMRVYPESKKLHVFVKRIVSRRAQGWNDRWETRLELAFKRRVQRYKDVQIVELQHKGTWGNRVMLVPGRANYHGFTVDHGQTAMLIVYTPERGAFKLDHSNPIPVFYLRLSPTGDYELEKRGGFRDMFGSIEKMPTGGNPELRRQLEIMRQRYTNLDAFAASKSIESMDEYRQRIHLEEVVNRQRNETRGLVMALADKTDHATNRMLDIRQEQITIERALKNAGKNKTDQWAKLITAASPVVTIMIVAYFLSVNPELFRQVGLWFSSPITLVVLFMGTIAGAVGIYYWRRRAR